MVEFCYPLSAVRFPMKEEIRLSDCQTGMVETPS